MARPYRRLHPRPTIPATGVALAGRNRAVVAAVAEVEAGEVAEAVESPAGSSPKPQEIA